MNKQEFYEQVAEILNYNYELTPFAYYKRTRWNNRTAGSGRFIGHGIIRAFGDNLISVCLHTPKINGTFNSYDSALTAIKNSVTDVD
jgi:hypothetical protein